MKISIFISFIIINFTSYYGQTTFLIKGKIVDSHHNSIQFCPIQIKSLSTISNENGEFELYIPESQINDTIKISYIGYHSKNISANQLFKNILNTISLIEHAYNLNEVIIVPTLAPELVVNNIILNFNKNFRTTPYNLTGFFRNYVKENAKYDKLIDGEINIHSKGFDLDTKKITVSDVFLNECRTSYSSGIHQEINPKNNLNILISRSVNLHKILLNKNYVFKVDKYEYRGDDKVIYLSFVRRDEEIGLLYSGYFVINEKNWGIEQIIYNKTDLNNSNNKFKQSLVDSIKLKHINDYMTVNFLYINNRYELSYLKMDYSNELISPNNKIIVSTTTEYLTNDFNSKSKRKGKKLNENGTLIKQTYNMPYHLKFWSKYNYLLENSELEQVKKDINEAKFNN